MTRLPVVKSPLSKESAREDEPNYGVVDFNTQDETLFKNPQFAHYEATSNIQLFFDLFFVANLTSFTNSHEINSRHNLVSYIGFISILWFTWFQITLYDLRFASDSVFERVAHMCHFGVMVGQAVIGPLFLNYRDEWAPLQQLSLILMGSRLVLFCQYGSTLFFTWSYRGMRAPLIVVMVSLAVAAIIYLGVSFTFFLRVGYNAYMAWYFVAAMEAVVNVGSAVFWPSVSLLKTHLVERMASLTLIILGEGIIGLTKTIVKIEVMDARFSSADIGMLIAAVLIIYFTYQLYFDNVCLGSLSSPRLHLWAVLHFPFHIALCLMMEGTNQTLLWSHIVSDLGYIFGSLLDAIQLPVPPPTGELQTLLNSTVSVVFNRFQASEDLYDAVQISLNETLALSADANITDFTDAAINAITTSMKTVIDGFGWETPELAADGGEEEAMQTYNAVLSVFDLTFGYFSICTGLIIIFVTIFSILSSKHDRTHYRLRYLSIIINMLVGLGIALLSIMIVTGAAESLGESPWALPGLMVILLALLVLHHLPHGRYESVVVKNE